VGTRGDGVAGDATVHRRTVAIGLKGLGCLVDVLPSLIVIRGNSGSGKSSTALAVRVAIGRGVALVGQDVIRRQVLRERDRPGAVNVGLIAQTVRYCLDHSYDVILEGILYSAHYGDMIRSLLADHAGPSFVYYYDLTFAETLRRHDLPDVVRFNRNSTLMWRSCL
jgi:hypothetical protein